MRRLIPALAVLCALASGCSDKSPGTGGNGAVKSATARLDAAQAAVDAGNWSGALAELDAVIADPKATGEEKAQAWADKVYCDAQASGEAAAKETLKKAIDAKAELTALQCYKLGISLKDADKFDAAIEVVGVATKKFEGDEKAKGYLDKLAKQIRKKAKEAGNTDAAEKLSALGYTGSSDDEDE